MHRSCQGSDTMGHADAAKMYADEALEVDRTASFSTPVQ